MTIRRLDPVLANRIAAGEVVERPSAAVKELVENALDAGATRIDVAIEGGGQKLIRVIDDGCGMDKADLALSIERHATSKIPDGDLANIATLGFRGEALPSIASVARLDIQSRARDAAHGWGLRVEFGAVTAPSPASLPPGTRIEVRDLFAATPARLKFLKSERAEAQAVADVVKRLAMAHPDVRFSLGGEGLAGFDHQACLAGHDRALTRLTQVLGRSSATTRFPSRASARGCMSKASPACRPGIAPMRWRNMSSSTADRCATARSPGPFAPPIWITCPPTGIRAWRCSSTARRTWSTSTCIRPRRRCASPIPACCADW